MPRIGISITKSTAFRNSTQEFTNVYFFDLLTGYPAQVKADTYIDDMKTKETPLHSTAVTFVRGRCWTETGDKATSNMISQKNLSGTGSATNDATMDRERAFPFRLRAGVDSRGNPV